MSKKRHGGKSPDPLTDDHRKFQTDYFTLILLTIVQVVRQMATLDQPWSCPHGRPTMRHLADMREITSISADLASPRRVKWAEFGQSMSVH